SSDVCSSDLSYEYKFNVKSKRTTIYLPATIPIKYPTTEINDALKKLDYLINSYKNNVFYDQYLPLNDNGTNEEIKGYQIILTADNISKLQFLRKVIGLSISELATICF